MRLNIFFTPAEVTTIQPAANNVFIVIDVIRATTSLTVMFERGARRVLAANTLEQARAANRDTARYLLCGERNARPLPDFDYGNSPVEFARADLAERELILTTTNGTRAFFACPEESIRLAGCFYNARAVTAYALAHAQERESDIAIVCAGELNYFALDDAVCAGYLALELQRQFSSLQLHESALAAQALYQAYPPAELIKHTNSARSVRRAGLDADLDFCIQLSASSSVPQVVGREQGLLALEDVARARLA
ncbi:2-phosphosulfolactate phosphatase [Ktedonosporobacter rubrisoli]|uniref:Probable 2-phosphosulfolactate phosphatase n=1 Tax=Ktedonosporobacter rubrisoli TaxID=2509675 RepID=A0A4P6K0Z3_KTERU|nr:2-phosphosulfolactate phosphatase [Ktedonosporobacter rubrisoli]QBD81320.1 2-phosphosulfolactate phosphatase [Ktedonosporobacter rubrisoli]